MKGQIKLLPSERRWLRFHGKHRTSSKGKPILAICGPSGVGKTTVSYQLSSGFDIYLECVSRNPYWSAYRRGEDFNAAANQTWFLETMFKFVRQCNAEKTLVLDQDPAAIVLVYSRLFLDDGLLNEKAYSEHVNILMQMEAEFLRWRSPRALVFLDAKSKVLKDRVSARSSGSGTPPLLWFQRLRRRFRDFRRLFPQAPTYSTHENRLENIVLHLQQICAS